MEAAGTAEVSSPTAVSLEVGVGKAINLPAWRKVAIDMDEVISGHTSGASRAIQSRMKSIFQDRMSAKQIESALAFERPTSPQCQQLSGTIRYICCP